ncbi:uncharacterized protein LOC143876505 [Tasmannia lanceolata]|uniref:uncharacterized protein LOC143876505 n=1 Tax=Tasmannia lanceolata TaxID=3420 RepID=UPI0040647AEA
MRCKEHPHEPGHVGICGSCLKERLLTLIAKETHAVEDRPKSDPPPTTPAGDTCQQRQQQQGLYTTPQVGPTFCKKKNTCRFPLFSSLFGYKAEVTNTDPRVRKSSWLSSLFSSLPKKKSRLFSLDEEVPDGRRDRGMSPVTETSKGKEEEGSESPIGLGYYSESSSGLRRPIPAARRQHARSFSGVAFCLSPLVRASPSNNNRHDAGFSGDIRSARRQICANRSRKLADIGRYP